MSDRVRARSIWRASLGLALLVLFALPATGHFLLNLNVRVFHVEHLADGVRLYLRTPMPYLVADKLGEPDDSGLPAPAPFTRNAREDGQVVHYVDPARIAADPPGLGRLAEQGIVLESGGLRLAGTVEQMVLHWVGSEPGFATLAEARAAVAGGAAMPPIPSPLYVGDAVVDVIIRYEAGAPLAAYRISARFDPGLPGQDQTANLLLDYGPGHPKVYRTRGLMQEPLEVSRSALAAIATFVWEGVQHILEGLDHVLFVICLVLSAATLSALLWRVTGFTIGHSVTLALGFFGYVPTGAWFVPAVETGIALSIIYAAYIAIRPAASKRAGQARMLLVTMAIGFLHGLGFSFVLQEILQVTSPNIWQSLLAFNVGVELGQLLIVLAIWPVFHLLDWARPTAGRLARAGVAAACMALAVFWTTERGIETASALQVAATE